MTKDEAKKEWGEFAPDYPDVALAIEARLLLTKKEAHEAVSAALRKEQAEREARVKGAS